MDRSQPIAVKVTDPSAPNPSKKLSKPPSLSTPAKVPIVVEKTLSERTQSMYSTTSQPTRVRPDTQGLKSISERQAELQQAIKPQTEPANPRSAVGSVQSRLEEFKAAASQSSAVNKHTAEVGMSMSERIAMFKKSTESAKNEDEIRKNQQFRTGKIAEMAAKLGNSEEKSVKTSEKVEITSNISERIQQLQKAIKSSGNSVKDLPSEGLVSLEERKKQLFTRSEVTNSKVEVPIESVKDRISLFSGGFGRNPEEEESSEEENEEEIVENEQIQREVSTRQSLMAKYAAKSTGKTIKKSENEGKSSEKSQEMEIKEVNSSEKVDQEGDLMESQVEEGSKSEEIEGKLEENEVKIDTDAGNSEILPSNAEDRTATVPLDATIPTDSNPTVATSPNTEIPTEAVPSTTTLETTIHTEIVTETKAEMQSDAEIVTGPVSMPTEDVLANTEIMNEVVTETQAEIGNSSEIKTETEVEMPAHIEITKTDSPAEMQIHTEALREARTDPQVEIPSHIEIPTDPVISAPVLPSDLPEAPAVPLPSLPELSPPPRTPSPVLDSGPIE